MPWKPIVEVGFAPTDFDKVALGVEMLGDYETESFSSSRGLAVRRNSIAAIATLSAVLGLDPDAMKLHFEDPLTDHDCPGKNVVKSEVIDEVKSEMRRRHGGDHGHLHD